MCGPAGRPVGASGCRGQWGATLHATPGTVPVPPKADTRAPGLHKLWDLDLMSVNPRIPRPELEGPLAWNHLGAQFSPTLPSLPSGLPFQVQRELALNVGRCRWEFRSSPRRGGDQGEALNALCPWRLATTGLAQKGWVSKV